MSAIVAPAVTATPEALELVEDRVFALGGTVEHRGRVSWVPDGAVGEAALGAYVCVEGDAAVMIDTSLPILEDAILRQLGSLRFERLKILLTRPVEFDSVGNAEMIVDRFPVETIYSQAEFAPEDWLYFRRQASGPVLPVRYESVVKEKDDAVEIAPGRMLTLVNAKLKLLACSWVFDEATGTLFTSDSFSHVLAPAPGVRVVTAADDTTTADDVFRHLMRKFDWLAGAETGPVREFVDRVFSRFDVRTVAPNLGCVLAGKDVVERHRELLDDALVRLAGEGEAK